MLALAADHIILDVDEIPRHLPRRPRRRRSRAHRHLRHQAERAEDQLRLYPAGRADRRHAGAPRQAFRREAGRRHRRELCAAKAICGIPATSCSAPTCCCRNWRGSSRSMAEAIEAAVNNATTDLGFLRLEPEAFARAPQKSIDYAVMEKTDRAAVVAGDFRWSDIGSWDALFDITPRDAARQCRAGRGRDHGRAQLHRAFRRPADRHDRRRGPGGGEHVRRGDGGAARARAGGARAGGQAQGRQPAGGDRAQARAPALGLLRVDRHGRALPGQAHRRHSRRHAVVAEAPPPRRALGGGARHRRGHHRRGAQGRCTRTS